MRIYITIIVIHCVFVLLLVAHESLSASVNLSPPHPTNHHDSFNVKSVTASYLFFSEKH